MCPPWSIHSFVPSCHEGQHLLYLWGNVQQISWCALPTCILFLCRHSCGGEVQKRCEWLLSPHPTMPAFVSGLGAIPYVNGIQPHTYKSGIPEAGAGCFSWTPLDHLCTDYTKPRQSLLYSSYMPLFTQKDGTCESPDLSREWDRCWWRVVTPTFVDCRLRETRQPTELSGLCSFCL